MEIAFALLGIGLTVLGAIFAYIWKSNGELQAKMMEFQAKMMTALERIEAGQEKLGEMLLNQARILERIEAKL